MVHGNGNGNGGLPPVWRGILGLIGVLSVLAGGIAAAAGCG